MFKDLLMYSGPEVSRGSRMDIFGVGVSTLVLRVVAHGQTSLIGKFCGTNRPNKYIHHDQKDDQKCFDLHITGTGISIQNVSADGLGTLESVV